MRGSLPWASQPGSPALGNDPRPRRLLVYGFEPFGPHASNPSQQLVRALHEQQRFGDATVWPLVLPVAYEPAAAALTRSLELRRPSAVLGLGLAAGRSLLSLERFAINLDDCAQPDNQGEVRRAQSIDPLAPRVEHSTADVRALGVALRGRGIEHEISHDAGGYLCNHSYYLALRHCAAREGVVPCVFVHVPPQALGNAPAQQIEAARLLLHALASQAEEVEASRASATTG